MKKLSLFIFIGSILFASSKNVNTNIENKETQLKELNSTAYMLRL